MAAIPKVSETQRLTQLTEGQKNNVFVRASEYNKLVDRVNSITTEDGVISITGDITLDDLSVGDDATITGDLTVSGSTSLAATTTTTLTATTTTLGATTTGELNFKSQVTDTGGAFATPIVLTAAQSGRVILIDDAAGLDFTLPAISAAEVGVTFKFIVTTTITSNSFRITAAAGDLLRGGVYIADFDTANTGAYFTPDESNDLIMALNGSTTGGKKGSVVTITAITATGWFVEGLIYGDGSLATPFS